MADQATSNTGGRVSRAARRVRTTLRRLSIGRRCALAGIVLVLPMTFLIAATAIVLQREEASLHGTIDEAVNALVPLTSLEYDLQRALTDELEARSGTAVPDFGGLTGSIDRLFARLRHDAGNPDVPEPSIEAAQQAWSTARPAVERLVEHVTPLKALSSTDSGSDLTREKLTRAIADIEEARTHLARAVKSRAATTAAAQQRELRTLLWAWGATLLATAIVVALVVYSIVTPARELGAAVRRLSAGDLSIRVDDRARDELGRVASYLNAMAARFAARRSALESEALLDSLTNLPNRRSILRALDTTLASCREQGSPVSVLLIDVDRFKQLNDRFGHTAGDAALSWLADAMRSSLRSGDLLGRYAGDEFIAVLPSTGADDARATAERLCDDVSAQRGSDSARPSITVGVATSVTASDTRERLIETADQALYEGKKAGRARIAVA